VNPLLDALHLIGTTPEIFFGKLRVGISLVDAHDGKILFANEEFARILGCPYDKLLREEISFLELTHPDDRERNSDLQKRLLAGEIDRYQLEKRYLRHDGSVIWGNVNVEAIRRSEDMIWSIALIEDITARKILEQQLDAATTVGAIATWNWNARSDTSTVSPSYNQLHGLPAATPAPSFIDVIGRTHPEDRERLQAAVLRGIANRTGHTEEYRIIRPDGAVRWLSVTATCLYDAAGEVTNLIGATIDITDAKMRQPLKNVSLPMRNVLQHIVEHWNEPISLKALGRLCGVSPRSIHNHFAAEGTTPNRHIKQVRLRYARQMLKNAPGGTTVTAVAVQCGFSNLGHFAKDYRQEFGEAPSETIKASK
jgi:PAS domain S-box-containing protein